MALGMGLLGFNALAIFMPKIEIIDPFYVEPSRSDYNITIHTGWHFRVVTFNGFDKDYEKIVVDTLPGWFNSFVFEIWNLTINQTYFFGQMPYSFYPTIWKASETHFVYTQPLDCVCWYYFYLVELNDTIKSAYEMDQNLKMVDALLINNTEVELW